MVLSPSTATLWRKIFINFLFSRKISQSFGQAGFSGFHNGARYPQKVTCPEATARLRLLEYEKTAGLDITCQ